MLTDMQTCNIRTWHIRLWTAYLSEFMTMETVKWSNLSLFLRLLVLSSNMMYNEIRKWIHFSLKTLHLFLTDMTQNNSLILSSVLIENKPCYWKNKNIFLKSMFSFVMGKYHITLANFCVILEYFIMTGTVGILFVCQILAFLRRININYFFILIFIHNILLDLSHFIVFFWY